MKQFIATINDPAGMHARPAGELVKLVKTFAGCTISIDNGTRKVNANSILSILSLGLKKGAQITVCAEGENEDAAIDAVKEFLLNLK